MRSLAVFTMIFSAFVVQAAAQEPVPAAVDRAPGNADVAIVQACLYIKEERLDEALAVLVKAVEAEADNEAVADCYFNMAIYFARQGDNGEAINLFNKCLRARPGFTAALLLLDAVRQADRFNMVADIERQAPL
ncbi:MAG: tetratricopeptide repeat protein [Candidatus Omnitrophica bacterium]|nr:tetratricopeptide repeat protein [Candidatus Omnitrophota bacterium]